MFSDTHIFFGGFIQTIDAPFCIIDLDPENDITFDDILPMQIGEDFTVKAIDWGDFSGEIESNSRWIAHTFWNISYSYKSEQINLVQQQQQVVRQLPKVPSQQNMRKLSPKVQTQERQNLRLPPLANPQDIQFKKAEQLKNPISISRQNIRCPSPNLRSKSPLNQQRGGSTKNQRNPSAKNLNNQYRLPSPNYEKQTNQQRSTSQSTQEDYPQNGIKVKVKVSTTLSAKSWVRHQSQYLLDHERGHYLIGSLCSLEFKRRLESTIFEESEFTQPLKAQIYQLFKTTLNQFLEIERKYDEETCHYLDQQQQQQWNRRIKEQLLLYQSYFNCN